MGEDRMPEWVSIAVSIAGVIVPLAALMWAIHRNSTNARQKLMEAIDRLHDYMHQLELRIVAIETRGHRNRRGDLERMDEE